jgi:hypothetical protein
VYMYVGRSKSSRNLNFKLECLWVHRNPDRCLPTHPFCISVASGVKLSSWVYCWWTYCHCCLSVRLRFRDGWLERAPCLYKVLFETWENRCRYAPNLEASFWWQHFIPDKNLWTSISA